MSTLEPVVFLDAIASWARAASASGHRWLTFTRIALLESTWNNEFALATRSARERV